MKIKIAILLLAAGVFASCKSSTSSTSSNDSTNNNGGGGAPANTMYVTTGGKTDTLTASGHSSSAGGISSVSVVGASLASTGAGFTLENISSKGTYDVGTVSYTGGTISGVFAMVYSYKDAQGNSVTYSSPANGTTSVGSLTITSISSTAIQATFSNCTLTLQSGNGPQTVLLTSGSVNATIM